MKTPLLMLSGTVGAALLAAAGVGAWSAFMPAPADEIAVTAKTDRLGLDPVTTSAIEPPAFGDIEVLDAALTALDAGDLGEARRLRDTIDSETIDHDLVSWAIAMSGKRDVGADEIEDVMQRLSDWPGRAVLERNHERALARGLMSTVTLRTAFAQSDPKTFEAAYALAKSHLLTGGDDRARALILPFWHTEPLTAAVEIELADRFGDVLTEDDHRTRYFNMMARERIRAGARIAEAAGMGGLHNAWAAVIRRTGDADRLIDAIPEELAESEAALFVRTERLRRQGEFEAAAGLIDTLDEKIGAMTNPDAWWNERRIVSRSLRERGDIETAYRLVAAHQGGSPTTQVDAVFHAGWYALRGLNDPEAAETHFAQIEQIATGPSSRARGAYWLGRTADAAGDDDAARAHYERAVSYPTVFYGQLAAQALGRDQLSIAEVERDPAVERSLRATPAFAALDRLTETGHERLARRLYYGLSDMFDDPREIAVLVDHAAQRGDHFTALRTAKRAAWRGVELGLVTHPVGAIPGSAELTPRDRALAYAIARQESEFNTNAVSHADARGLLQLLPSTARAVASRMELSYAPSKLTEDPAFNALLGTRYLDEQRDRFGGSYVLTFIAYNAGPGRAREWIERFGDPRGLALEQKIDWIEQIPFPETRQYVQKVMENLTVYKARFGLPLTIETDLTSGAG